MPNPSATVDSVTVTIANGGTTSNTVAIGNPTELGLIVPALTASTLKVQVGFASDGSDAKDVYDGTGTQTLTFASGTGSFAIGSNHMGACLGYPYLTLVCGSAQAAQRDFKLIRKVAGVDPTA